jgi:CTP:molybdopterin cytidylyltransferase MocA
MGAFKPLLPIVGQPMIRRTVFSAVAGGAAPVCVVLGREARATRATLADIPDVIFVENTGFATSDMLASVQLGLRALLVLGGGVEEPAHLSTATLPAGTSAAVDAAVVAPSAPSVIGAAAAASSAPFVTPAAGAAATSVTEVAVVVPSATSTPSTTCAIDAVFILPGDMPAVSPATFRLLRERAEGCEAATLFPTLEKRRGHPLLLKREACHAVLAYPGEGGVKAAVAELAYEAVACADVGILLDTDTPEALTRVRSYLN